MALSGDAFSRFDFVTRVTDGQTDGIGVAYTCCEIAIGLRPSLYRRKPLVQLCYFYRSVFGSF